MIKLNPPFIPRSSINLVTNMLHDGDIVGGKMVSRLETALSNAFNFPHVIACSSGTTALEILLAAHGVGRRDEVVVPGFTFKATINAIMRVGAYPVIANIDKSWRLDVNKIERFLTKKTKAIIPVHLYGAPVHIGPLLGLGIPIIEDACQAIGSKYKDVYAGNLGHAAAFSLYGSKNIGAGEGGFITTHDEYIAKVCRKLINHENYHEIYATNGRLSEVQAAIALGQVNEVNIRNAVRRANAMSFFESGLYNPQCEDEKILHNYHLYTIQFHNQKRRDDARSRCKESGIQTGIYYEDAWPSTPSETILSVPVHHNLTYKEIEKIIKVVRND